MKSTRIIMASVCNPFTARVKNFIMETSSLILTFEFVDKILWSYHLRETSLAVLLHGNININILCQYFMKWNLEFFLNFSF